MLTDDYWTLQEPGTAQTRVLGSRFSASAFQLNNDVTIEPMLESASKHSHDASHHCWASIIRSDDNLLERQSDAGEPKGTAGLPILLEIRKQQLQNCAVIVTRWFGGTKLGTGGLVRAYAECAALAIHGASRVLRKTGITLEVKAPYESHRIVYQLATKFAAIVEPVENGDGTQLNLKLRRAQINEFNVALRDMSAGKLIGSVGVEWTS